MTNDKQPFEYRPDGVHSVQFVLTGLRPDMFEHPDRSFRPLTDVLVAACAVCVCEDPDSALAKDVLVSPVKVTHAAWLHANRGMVGTVDCGGRHIDVSVSLVGNDKVKRAHLIDRDTNESESIEFPIGPRGAQAIKGLHKIGVPGVDQLIVQHAKTTLREMDTGKFAPSSQVFRGMIRADSTKQLSPAEINLVHLLGGLTFTNIQSEAEWARDFASLQAQHEPLPENWQESFIHLTRHVIFDVSIGASHKADLGFDMEHPSYDAFMEAGFSPAQAREFFLNQALVTRGEENLFRIEVAQRQALGACFRSAEDEKELADIFEEPLVRRLTLSDGTLSHRGNLVNKADWAAVRTVLSAAKLKERAAGTEVVQRRQLGLC